MMYPLQPERSDRWQSLIHASEHITFASSRDDFARSQESGFVVLEQVRSLKEIFGPALDPVDDFEGYAVRQLLKSLEAVLSHR